MKITQPNIVKQMVQLTAKPLCNTDAEKEAYIKGANMMYEFCVMNPQLIKSKEAQDFRNLLFPSVINV